LACPGPDEASIGDLAAYAALTPGARAANTGAPVFASVATPPAAGGPGRPGHPDADPEVKDSMNTKRRLYTVTGGTVLALVLGTAAVGAQTPDDTAWDPGSGQRLHQPGDFGGRGGFGGRGMDRGMLGDRGEGILGHFESLVSQVVVSVADNGEFVTDRVDHGTVTAVDAASISVSLATGETSTAAIDADTDVAAFDLSERPIYDDAAVADIAAGAEVMVWSESQADGSFLAERIVIIPAEEADTTTDEESTTEG
jgi:hypothetical protein